MIGKTLGGRYYVIKELGQGGFGKTYLTEDTHLPNRPYRVLKHLKPQEQNPEVLEIARRLFGREAETLSRLGKHPQIPELFAHFEENQEFFLVQEWIDGSELSQEIIYGQKLSENTVKKLLKEILSILVFVHEEKVIHRDLKPPNIMRRRSDNQLVLIDFGAVKQVALTGNIPNHAGTIIGTLGYSPYEQKNGFPVFASDIYAVGMIAIEALSGLYPHELTNPNTGEIIFPNLAIAPSFKAILKKMVKWDKKYRYADAKKALNALESIDKSQINPFHKPLIWSSIAVILVGGITWAGITIFQPQKPDQNQTCPPNCPPDWKW
jgi:serine/threonine-protein kinase